MTTTDLGGTLPPSAPPPFSSSPGDGATPRVLRRSRTGRAGAGVASGLGAYFGVDPVLFRVLFATSAFFGGAGLIAYLLAWAAIPEEGTAHAPLDGWMAGLRRRQVPLWAVALGAGVLLWVVAFSWWAPGPFVPVVGAVVLLAIFLGRRDLRRDNSGADGTAAMTGTPTAGAPTVDLTKTPASPAAPPEGPSWVADARMWFDESRATGRLRRRRAAPVRLGTLAALVVGVGIVGIVDAVDHAELQAYFWTALAVLVAGLLVGAVTRRFPLALTPLLIPLIIGTVAFAGSHVGLRDGIGQRQWEPQAAPAAHYRLAIGDGELDLRRLAPQSAPRTVHVTAGAGRIRIRAPKTLNLIVQAHVHFGTVQVDGYSEDGSSGAGVTRTVLPPQGASGPALTIDVHLADGDVSVERS